MAAELIIVPEARRDLADAYDWYEDRRPGLGEEFLSCVEACIENVCRMPELHRTVHENYRRAIVRRFTYAVFYEHEMETVTIYCIFHCSQNPEKWRRRLP